MSTVEARIFTVRLSADSTRPVKTMWIPDYNVQVHRRDGALVVQREVLMVGATSSITRTLVSEEWARELDIIAGMRDRMAARMERAEAMAENVF